MQKILCLCSGGFDSVVMLHLVREENPTSEIHTLFFNYGQKNVEQEFASAKNNSDKLGCILHKIDLPRFSWTSGEFYSPEFSGSSEYLEMRNLVFIAYALSLCESTGISSLYMATLKSLGYYDTSESFLSKVSAIAEDKGIKFITPFSQIEKGQLAYLANKYEIKSKDFFTCDNPVEGEPCGKCPDCELLKLILNYKPLPVERFLETADPEDPIFQKRFEESEIKEIRLYTNHLCQLHCEHCYYGYSDLSEPLLTDSEYRELFTQASQLGIDCFHFCGKEPLYDSRVFEVIKILREVIPNSDISFVTNGINVPKFAEQLSNVNPSKVCLSVDDVSTEKGVRGVKNVSHKALRALSKFNIPTEVFIDLHLGNYNKVYDILEFLYLSYGVKSFLIRTIVPIGCATKMPKLSKSQLNSAFVGAKDFFTEYPETSGVFNVGIEYTYEILTSGAESLSIRKCIEKVLDNRSLRLTDNFLLFPKLYCSSYENQLTITADGYVQGCASESCYSDYRKASVGSVREKPLYDLIRLGKEKTISHLKEKSFLCSCTKPLDFI